MGALELDVAHQVVQADGIFSEARSTTCQVLRYSPTNEDDRATAAAWIQGSFSPSYEMSLDCRSQPGVDPVRHQIEVLGPELLAIRWKAMQMTLAVPCDSKKRGARRQVGAGALCGKPELRCAPGHECVASSDGPVGAVCKRLAGRSGL